MQNGARRSLWFASKLPARIVAGRRHPPSRTTLRSFHSSPYIQLISPSSNNSPKPSDNDHFQAAVWNSEQNRWESIGNSPIPQEFGDQSYAEFRASGGNPDNNNSGNGGGEKERNGHYGSALRRSMRNKKPREIPPLHLPVRFLRTNVRRYKFDAPLGNGVLNLTGNSKLRLGNYTEEVTGDSARIATPGDSKVDRPPDSLANTDPKSQDSIQSQAGTGKSALNASKSLSDRDGIIAKFQAMLEQCSKEYMAMEKAYGPLGENLKNWENLTDKFNEISNLATKYKASASNFENIANDAFAAFPNGELARKLSSEPEPKLGESVAKHISDLETALDEFETNSDPIPKIKRIKPMTYYPQYGINHLLFSEVLALISAGLSLPRSDNPDSFASKKSHLKLLCPIDGGTYFLDKVVEEVATRLCADMIVLDSQDIAELATDFLSEDSGRSGNTLSSLGFDAAQVFAGSAAAEPAEEEEADIEDGAEEESSPKIGSLTAIPLSAAPREMQNIIKKFFNGSGDLPVAAMSPQGPYSSGHYSPAKAQLRKPNSLFEAKLTQLLETVVEANIHKRNFLNAEKKRLLPFVQSLGAGTGAEAMGQKFISDNLSSQFESQDTPSIIPLQGVLQFTVKNQNSDASPTKVEAPRTIVLLRDFKEIRSTAHGAKLVQRIVDIVSKKRSEGQEIMIVGTSSSIKLMPLILSESLQGEDTSSVFRPLAIAPDKNHGLYFLEEKRRFRTINSRHLFAMLKRLDPATLGLNLEIRYGSFIRELHLLTQNNETQSLEDHILSFDEIHRIMFTAMGQRDLDIDENARKQRIQVTHIARALFLIKQSDEIKASWTQDAYQIRDPPTEPDRRDNASTESRLKMLRKTCGKREKALLRGVIDPENIQTTFSDVHATPETIEALKTLTTLSLTRPDAFKYGVLAKDKLSGLLLYGPPGTGKTMLAKAVAKQNGATMLEVSGSDLYDMYVGEGEKNVRAVFSLAKKLAPCVVFIDEADAIFGSRGAGSQRNSHRELINQFLREWDGMNETSAFVMVATNRPFDVDDAALRRLPRRILVDLPSEKDREAILRIHLKEEIVDASVSLATLASRTPLYSGSDLKNVAVAAALAAVREEGEEANKHTGAEPYQYPEKRTLNATHFDTAMEEISASVSEDMSSLGAIRKFDEKYGDRRGRRKKATYGFSSTGVAKEETAKVRT